MRIPCAFSIVYTTTHSNLGRGELNGKVNKRKENLIGYDYQSNRAYSCKPRHQSLQATSDKHTNIFSAFDTVGQEHMLPKTLTKACLRRSRRRGLIWVANTVPFLPLLHYVCKLIAHQVSMLQVPHHYVNLARLL